MMVSSFIGRIVYLKECLHQALLLEYLYRYNVSVQCMNIVYIILPIFAEIRAILTNTFNLAAEWIMKDHLNGGDYLQAGWLG